MAPRKTASSPSVPPSSIPIGNCEVSVEAKKFACESEGNSLQISVSRNVKIRISVRKDSDGESNEGHKSTDIGEGEREIDASREDMLTIVLSNPKDTIGCSRSFLQTVLEMYSKELPTMKYAANTGKHSTFLERCVMSGKYCSLLLNMPEGDSGKVIGAITYQIVSADTQYAEIPLAAVNSVYQQKGVGRTLFVELRKRLQSVGVTSIICWGDKESQGFWHKLGFVSLAEVGFKGRTRRLPIKANIRKALSFPGGSTLMILHLKQDSEAHTADSLKLSSLLQPKGKPSSAVIVVPDPEDQNAVEALKQSISGTESPHPEMLVHDGLPYVEKKIDGHQCQDEVDDTLLIGRLKSNKSAELSKNPDDNKIKHCSCSTQGSGAKKRVWEASLSSLKSKKVKGSIVDCQLGSKWDPVSQTGLECSHYYTCNLEATENNSSIGEVLSSTRQCFKFKIMLMDIADDIKKANLSKVITDLGGIVTSDGCSSTHVITGKVRATLNLCTALCSGAWIVSPHWLKESFRHGKFLDEMPYILNDKDYQLKYKTELKTAVLRAKASSGALLNGYDVCLPSHGGPSVKPLSAIVRSAGGNIIGNLGQVNSPSKTIFVASEEDVEEAMVAAKQGIWTFCSDWLMNSVMKQHLDFEAPKFAESL